MRSFRSAGGAGVPTVTLGRVFLANFATSLAIFAVKRSYRKAREGDAKDAKRNHPSPPQPGYAPRPERSETLLSHYRTHQKETGFKVSGFQGFAAIAFRIAASAIGAMILYPASFGCSPSSASSFFSNPLSSTSAEK